MKNSNAITYIYVKRAPTGMLYLGKTTQNPNKYLGSGIHWKRHIKHHNINREDIETYILHETCDELEIASLGLYYSILFDVVKSERWANMKEEIGDGGFGKGEAHPWYGRKKTAEHNAKVSEKLKGNKNNLGKKHSDSVKKKMSEAQKGRVYEKIECPHCKKMVAKFKADKWHFDNCSVKTGIKHKPISQIKSGKDHPFYGKKRPDHSEWMKKNNPNSKKIT